MHSIFPLTSTTTASTQDYTPLGVAVSPCRVPVPSSRTPTSCWSCAACGTCVPLPPTSWEAISSEPVVLRAQFDLHVTAPPCHRGATNHSVCMRVLVSRLWYPVHRLPFRILRQDLSVHVFCAALVYGRPIFPHAQTPLSCDAFSLAELDSTPPG